MEAKTFESVFDAIADTPAEAANMRLRAELMQHIESIIKGNHWTQKQAAVHCGITQPRINDLLNGKIDKFSIDSLIDYLAKIGYKVNLGVHESNKSPISIQFVNVNKKLKKPTFGKKYIREQLTQKAA